MRLMLDACCSESLLGQKQSCPLPDPEAIQMAGYLEVVVRIMDMKALARMGNHAFEFFGRVKANELPFVSEPEKARLFA